MNVPLPLAKSPYAFPLMLSLMVIVAGGMLFYFKKKHWM